MNPLLLALLTMIALALLLAGLLRPKPMLLLAVATVVLFPHGTIERDYILEVVVGALLLAPLLGLCTHMVLGRVRGAIPAGWDRRVYFAFLAVMLVNGYISVSGTPDLDWMAYGTKVLGFWLFIIFVKLFYAVIRSDPAYVGKIFWAFALSGALNVALILVAALDTPDRATNLFGQSLMLPLPIVAATLAFYQFLRTRRASLLWMAAFSLSVLAVLLTASRGLALALLAAVALLALFRRGLLSPPKAALLLPLLVAALWLGGGFFERILSYDARDTVHARYDEIGMALNAFYASPVLGNGIGYRYIGDSLELRLAAGSDYIHNAFFFILTSFGLSGLVVFAAYLVYSLRLVFRHRSGGDLFLLVGLSGLGIWVYSLTQAIFFTLSYNLYMAFVMAVAIKDSNEK